jgi:hypothetical protein
MDSTMRGRLHDLTLRARRLLTDETRDLLEGVYGLHQNGSLEEPTTLPAIQSLEEARETRAHLECLLADERDAGMKLAEAVEKLVRETAFTWLNRLAALKMLEARGLVRQSILRGSDSNGFKFWLTTLGNETELRCYEAGSLPLDELGEGPRDTAYRHYLLHLCTEMATQIRILFDPDTVSSRLCPRPHALAELLALLNHSNLAEVWSEDETIGWIYQSFNAEELERAFREARLSGKKFEAADIPAVTQLFTPRWVVRFLVENTLGRLWLQMHPNSHLVEQLKYLVPVQDVPWEPLRQVREITVLDPACGTMHFGLVAFDLLTEMYREELEHVGAPGWPHEPSVSDAAEIPAAILEHNLFGIDIDLRAVQLSALTLYLKAKALNPQAVIRQSNLACANIHLLDGPHLASFLGIMQFSRAEYEQILKPLWDRLHDVEQLGSLLRVEQDMAAQIEVVRKRIPGQGRLPLPGTPSLFGEDHSEEEYRQRLTRQILQAFEDFAQQQAQQGLDEAYFVGEASKGLRLLSLLLRRYDVVVTNPPYMSNHKMNERLKKLVGRAYPAAKSDLYAAFLQRCLELVAPHGRVGMLTMHSFMFINSYESLRVEGIESTVIEALAHLGPALFAVGNPGTLQTAAYILRRELDASRRANSTGIYFRLVREPDVETKQLSFERAVAALRMGNADPAIYCYRQGDFAAIPGTPLVYWITPSLRQLFTMLPKLGEVTQTKYGLSTCDNFRFLRYSWEIAKIDIAFRCDNMKQAEISGKRWFPIMKGGGFLKWWGNQMFLLNWKRNGEELKAWIEDTGSHWTRRIFNINYYFRRGLTYTTISSKGLSVRLMPEGMIFDHAGNCIFPDDYNLTHYFLALLNSPLVAYLLRLLNPTINFYTGDIERIPFPQVDPSCLIELTERIIILTQAGSMEDEITYEFVAPPTWPRGADDVAARARQLAEVEHQIDEEVYRLYSISVEDRQAIEAELAEPTLTMDDVGENGENEPTAEDIKNISGDSTTPNASTVASGLTRQELAARWVSYAIGIVLGRFQPGVEGALGSGRVSPEQAASLRALAVPNGVAVLDSGHEDDLVALIERALALLVGEAQVEPLLTAATGERQLSDWLVRDYFKLHVQQYRKRPIYWLLQSPKKLYSLWLSHEHITRDTLHLLQGNRYLGGRINRVRSEVQAQQQRQAPMPQGAERRRLEREIDTLEGELTDLEMFAKALATVTSQANTRGQIVGWAPEVDDGVLINLAPLWTLLPSWSVEPKQCWQALERGDYDWSHTAMRYWPDRVLAKCQTNLSYALAHGVAAQAATSHKS